VSSYDWWCEPIWFDFSLGHKVELVGWNKIYLISGCTTSDGAWVEVDNEDDRLMAYRDTCFILEELANWSRVHDLAWEISLAGEPIGAISGGDWDEKLRSSVESMKATFPWPASFEQKVRNIWAKYAFRS
jgi:hypothetical protein